MYLCKDDCNFREAVHELGDNFYELGRWVIANTSDVTLTLRDVDGNTYSFWVSKLGLNPDTVGRNVIETYGDIFDGEGYEEEETSDDV